MAGSWAQTQALRLSAIVALLAFSLIIVAGVDLGANGANASIGRFKPETTIAATHLILALLTATATFSLVGLAWARLRGDARITRISRFAVLLIVLQVVVLSTPATPSFAPWATAIHFGASALLMATALSLSVGNRAGGWVYTTLGDDQRAVPRLAATLAGLAAVGVLSALTSGAYLGASGSQGGCSGWPLCESATGSMALLEPHNAHRLLVGGSGVLLIALSFMLWRSGARMIAPGALLAIFAAEALVGAFSAGGHGAAMVAGTHFAAAGAAWAVLVVVGLAVFPPATSRTSITAVSIRTLLRDYLRVTKPGIMTLLLITTLGAMLIAPGWPSIWLVLATLLGGAMASGGASALNCYLDRDIDLVMARTRKRPIPTGALTPVQVRTFGLILSAAAVIELWLLVNPVAAMLALGGNLFYVVVYTKYLKHATPQNIVIGGAAGAFPPLVGWAAVTGTVSLTSMLLFALIFYWTPPHFWSLALLKAKDYERAGIPMLPVTHGEHQTRKHILLYSFMLVAITLIAVPASVAGAIYLVVALTLGAVFIGLAARMYVEQSSRLAWRLFKYSNYYLAAILLAMVADRAFPI